MKRVVYISVFCILYSVFFSTSTANATDLAFRFQNPPKESAPWVYWYWMRGAVSREGITADLEAMKEIGYGGVYLFFIQDAPDPPLFDPPARQMTPVWWDLVRHAVQEADRLGLPMGLHTCDGFSIAGGPWITPEKSMQKLVWTSILVEGGRNIDQDLIQPETLEGYYSDIAVLALPAPEGAGVSTRTVIPKVTTSVPDVDPEFLVVPGNTQRLRSYEPCWIQYSFDEPFTCRSLNIRPDGTSFQPMRLRVEASDDGKVFRLIEQLVPPRHGWQNGDADFTYTIQPTTARYFRFVYDPAGTEPGCEDLDTAKWRSSLKVQRIELFSRAQIHQVEGKSGLVWRMSSSTPSEKVSDELCVPRDDILNISSHLDKHGRLQWQASAGQWLILRLGCTSTGHRNGTGGAAVGLECDKFDPEVVRFHFDHWFGEIVRQIGPDLARRVIKVLHTDSWETGSQNWSPVFREAFIEQHGYDPLNWLPVMAGIPIESAAASERFLLHVRQTIDELINSNFYGTLVQLAHEHGCQFSAESEAPVMPSDNLRHFGTVDLPMGEFWFRSPTHDKPYDILDAISGAHIYGKPVVSAEAFTELRFEWDEHPGLLKALGDRNYCLGINRLVYHVYAQNPWLDRRPGMSLGPTGIFFQRDQTWFDQGKAWVDYARRCQALLQVGSPVVDVAVFTGEDLPSRAVLPERLVGTLPGLMGPQAIKREVRRRANHGQPLLEMPRGVRANANITRPADWIDPLCGYAYDSINVDALMNQAQLTEGNLVMPGGVRYRALVVPGPRPMSPNAVISPTTQEKLKELVDTGVPVIMATPIGGAVKAPYTERTLASLGIQPDVTVGGGQSIAWCHRTTAETEIYFLSNQLDREQTFTVSLRVTGKVPELWDPLTAQIRPAGQWTFKEGRTELPLRLAAQGSLFVVLQAKTDQTQSSKGNNWVEAEPLKLLDDAWTVTFDPDLGGPDGPVEFDPLTDWSRHQNAAIKGYSGTAIYRQSFACLREETQRIWLDLGEVHNMTRVILNGHDCGVAWTAPYRVDVTEALQAGTNQLQLEVVNTWANRLITDTSLPEDQRITWTLHPERAGTGPLLPAGLLGPVQLLTETTSP